MNKVCLYCKFWGEVEYRLAPHENIKKKKMNIIGIVKERKILKERKMRIEDWNKTQKRSGKKVRRMKNMHIIEREKIKTKRKER